MVRQLETPVVSDRSPAAMTHVTVQGKFLFAGDEKLYVRGVTYGTFRPDEHGNEFSDPHVVEADFAAMSESGFNAVRVYTVPPRWLLDCAQAYGLRVVIGLPWEQHITFLDDRKRARAIEERVRAGVRACAGHPAVLCYAVGNEIPSGIVRWHGAKAIERFLQRLYKVAKEEDPEALVTYVNYPSTEYLNLDFVDFLCFNVYLESEDALQAYIARLHNLAGERPLVMAEIGLDSRRNGEDRQAEVLDWQVRTVFGSGAAGIFLFSWTDEWQRGGADIDDWDFGLVDRQRCPKPALRAVARALAESPFPPGAYWPRISVVVCSHNGARTLQDCCEGICELDYPNFEAILVDDGSSDETPTIGRRYGLSVISTENRGLSSARNTGLEAVTGEIVAYIDDDARPDPHWLRYLAMTFMRTEHVGVGGPNIAPPGDGWVADCVANSPGGPVHVLLTDELAEHIPGCNMAYRAEALRAIGGFDPIFRAAGDDVDVCWRLQERDWTLGFSPAAMVWHYRRNSIRAYWKQQKGYGRAEALLERKWPERYNRAGHITWGGRLYGKGLTLPVPWGKKRIYSGTWGLAPFQSVYGPPTGLLRSLPLMPEWYAMLCALAGLCAVGLLCHPVLIVVPLLVVGIVAPILQSVRSASEARFTSKVSSRRERLQLAALTALLHLIQPAARLAGRVRHGLTLWRRRGPKRLDVPWPSTVTIWSETWRDARAWVADVEQGLKEHGVPVARGGDFDRWDLTARCGLFGSARVLMSIEEHGAGKQLARFRLQPVVSWTSLVLIGASLLAAVLAALEGVVIVPVLLGGVAALIVVRLGYECAVALGTAKQCALSNGSSQRSHQ